MSLIFICLLFIFLVARMRFMMMFFQQEEYDGGAFLKLCAKKARFIDKKVTVGLAILWLASFYFTQVIWLTIPLFAYFAWQENKFLRSGKIKLATTARVKRIYFICSLLIVLILYLLFSFFDFSFFVNSILCIQIIPFVMVAANLFLVPVEKFIRLGFLRQARAKLDEIKPVVIGVTGSYGKTSVKHIMAHIMSAGAPVLFTPGSVNTLMGVCRIINRDLKPDHKYFIVEMGAYRIGSIAKLCRLVKPVHGIITAIGSAHFERFKTKENVAKAKFELAEAVQKNSDGKGFTVVNATQIEKRFITPFPAVIKFGQGCDFAIDDVKQNKDGISFTFIHNGVKTALAAPIFGTHHAVNIGLAVTLALKLGLPMSTIAAKLMSLPQINHRLEVRKNDAANIITIDDAYNSNVDGFKAALELLGNLKSKDGRTIIVTPGMIEMGALHDELHYELGKIAGRCADIAVLVAADRIKSFAKGFKETAPKDASLSEFPSRYAAFAWLNANSKAGDIVLLENDLTDAYEFRFSL